MRRLDPVPSAPGRGPRSGRQGRQRWQTRRAAGLQAWKAVGWGCASALAPGKTPHPARFRGIFRSMRGGSCGGRGYSPAAPAARQATTATSRVVRSMVWIGQRGRQEQQALIRGGWVCAVCKRRRVPRSPAPVPLQRLRVATAHLPTAPHQQPGRHREAASSSRLKWGMAWREPPGRAPRAWPDSRRSIGNRAAQDQRQRAPGRPPPDQVKFQSPAPATDASRLSAQRGPWGCSKDGGDAGTARADRSPAAWAHLPHGAPALRGHGQAAPVHGRHHCMPPSRPLLSCDLLGTGNWCITIDQRCRERGKKQRQAAAIGRGSSVHVRGGAAVARQVLCATRGG